MKGRIHKIVEADKIGFITDEKGVNRFFHFDQVIQGTPSVDQIVDFVESSNKKGPSAEKLVILPTLWGMVKALPSGKDFGFITDPDGQDRFFHFSQLKGTNTPGSVGDRVVFTPSTGKQGLAAENVFILKTSSPGETTTYKSAVEQKPPTLPKSTPKAPPSTKVDAGGSSRPPARGKPGTSSRSSQIANDSPSQQQSVKSKVFRQNQDHVNISNQTIKCNVEEKHGISLVGCNDVTIENVQVLKSDFASLRIANCHRIAIKNCTFENSFSQQGIYIVNSSEITLDHVICKGNANDGIAVSDGSHDIKIISSNLSDNVKFGLRVSNGHHITCEDVKFNDAGKENGISFRDVQDVTFSKCRFMNNHYSGIVLQDCTEVSFTACKFSENRTRNGIHLKEVRAVTFEGCEFNSNKGYAFDISKSEDVSVLNCQLHDNESGYGEIAEKSFVKLMDPNLKGNGVFKLRNRSQLRTNLEQPSLFRRTIFREELFDTDNTSEVIPL